MLICRKITPCSLVRKSPWWPVVRKWHSCLCIRNLPPTHLFENTPPTHLSENPPPGQWSEAKIRQLRDRITDACTVNMSHFFPLLKQSYSHPTTTTCELSMPWMITRKKKKGKDKNRYNPCLKVWPRVDKQHANDIKVTHCRLGSTV